MNRARLNLNGRRLAWLFLAAVASLASRDALAQRAVVEMQREPCYVGEPILVRVTAEDFDETPQPTCEPTNVDADLSVKLVSAAPSVSSVVQIINGRHSEYKTVKFIFDFHVTASKPGLHRIGGFLVSQGVKSARTRDLSIQFNEVEIDPDMRILLQLPSDPIFPGQRVPVTLEWWYAGSLQSVELRHIRAGLFDQFKFVDEPPQRGDQVIHVTTGTLRVQLKASVESRKLDGREYAVVSARRTLIADKPGRYELAPISVTIDKVTAWTRDVFGRPRPAQAKRVRAVGKPQTLVVESLPLSEAPPGFAGAVGQSFSIDVAADRTVVRAGDPIRLTITIGGDGNIESAGLAPLGYEGGLDPKAFRSPDTDATGIVSDDGRTKQFDVTVRVLDAAVDQVPPITYSWFDPVQRQYQTSQSSPIALQVLAGKVIGAQDVVDASELADAQTTPAESPGSPASPDDLTGADLTIQTDLSRLTAADADRFGGTGAQITVYGASVLAVLAAWWRRRAADVDPKVIERRQVLSAQLAQIQKAVSQPRQGAAREIGAACRQMIPYARDGQRPELDALIGECDALAFAPAGDNNQRINGDLHRRAVELAQRIAQERS